MSSLMKRGNKQKPHKSVGKEHPRLWEEGVKCASED